MGYGAWTTAAYNTTIRDMGFTDAASLATAHVQDVYRENHLHPMLNPYNVMRECRDSEDHPQTIPVILALDVTGSMGSAATTCAGKLDEIMTNLYGCVKDVEFLMMGIGDLACDSAPIQASQFESDIRILDQTTKIYFEGGGGGNAYESYTAAWYFGLRNTDLDCWKRGKKGIIITMGDEPLNPYLPGYKLQKVLGISTQDINTKDLYKAVTEKFDVYHIAIADREGSYDYYKDEIEKTWRPVLDDHLIIGTSNDLPRIIKDIVSEHEGQLSSDVGSVKVTEEGIVW